MDVVQHILLAHQLEQTAALNLAIYGLVYTRENHLLTLLERGRDEDLEVVQTRSIDERYLAHADDADRLGVAHAGHLLKLGGYTKEQLQERFGALYTAFQYGAPPHAGIAPGVDRMIMLLTGEETIREVIAFPLNSKAQDLMMGAPSKVSNSQLRDVHIKLDIKE